MFDNPVSKYAAYIYYTSIYSFVWHILSTLLTTASKLTQLSGKNKLGSPINMFVEVLTLFAACIKRAVRLL